MENFLLEIKKFILSKILRKYYYRTGKCKACGKCCTKIYVKHFKHVIQDEEEFKKLQYLHRFYTYLKVIGKDEIGLIFECENLDYETRKCKIHNRRPGICRRYPQEELFSMGGGLSEDCGYKMLPIVSFSKVLKNLSKNKVLLIAAGIFMLAIPVRGENGFSDKFIDKFQTCSIYGEENTLNRRGTVYNDMKFFYPGDGGICNYREIVSTSYGTLILRCKFNENQVFNLHSTMRTSDSKSHYSDAAENLWNIFANDKSVCEISIKTFADGKPAAPEEYLPWNP